MPSEKKSNCNYVTLAWPVAKYFIPNHWLRARHVTCK